MLACSDRERLFVWAYLTNGDSNAAQAARDAGYSDHLGADRVSAHHLMHRQRVLDALDEVGRKAFKGLMIQTIMAAERMIAAKDHPDHQKTVMSMLSRFGLGEKTSVDVNVNGEVTVNHTDQAVEDLRIMRQMGASREKLLEAFGFSGLPRLEKMLDSATSRQQADHRNGMKVIEHDSRETSSGDK